MEESKRDRQRALRRERYIQRKDDPEFKRRNAEYSKTSRERIAKDPLRAAEQKLKRQAYDRQKYRRPLTEEQKQRKRFLRSQHKEKERLAARDWYCKNKEQILTKIAANTEKRKEYNDNRRRKRRLNPEIAKARDKRARERNIKSYISRFSRGLISSDELDRRLRQSLIRADERLKRADAVRRWHEQSGAGGSEGSSGVCEADSKPDKTQT